MVSVYEIYHNKIALKLLRQNPASNLIFRKYIYIKKFTKTTMDAPNSNFKMDLN